MITSIFILIVSLGTFLYALTKMRETEDGWSTRFTWGFIFLILSFILPITSALLKMELAIPLVLEGTVLFILAAIILLTGMFKVRSKPISVSIIKKKGILDWKTKGVTVSKKHGWRFLLLFGIWYTRENFAEGDGKEHEDLDITRRNLDFPDIETIMPGGASTKTDYSLTYTPGYKMEDGTINYYPFLMGGKETNIVNILSDKIPEEHRIWAGSEIYGPQSWNKLQESGEEGVAILLKKISGNDIKAIPSKIPTVKWFQFFGKLEFYSPENESPDLTKEKIQDYYDAMNSSQENELKKAIDERWEIVKSIKDGNGAQPLSFLGVTLNRLNMGKVKVDPELMKALNKKPIERAERTADKIELDWIQKYITDFYFVKNEDGNIKLENGKPIKLDIEFSPKDIADLIQSERKKINKTVHVEKKEYRLDSDTVNLISSMAIAVIKELKNKEGAK